MQPLLARIGIDSAAFEAGMGRVRALAESAGVAVSRSFSDAGTKFTRLTGQIKEHEQQLRSLGMTLGAVGASLSAVAALGTKAAIAQESAFAGIRKTVEATEADFRQLKAALTDLSNRLPVPYTDLARIGELAGQLGVSGVENITRFVEVMARIVPASNLTVEAASTGFAKLANIMQEPIRNVDRMAAVVVELGIKGVTSEAQILEFAERLGVAGKIAGLTTANVLSLSSAMASVGVEAEAGGTAGTKMLIALSQAVSTANEKLAIFAELAAIAPAEFQKLFRTDPMEAFVRVIEGLGKAGEGAFQFLNDLMGNEIRLTRVTLGLGNAVGLLRTDVARGTQQWKENAALMRVSEERFKTTESALLTLRNAVSNLAASFGESLLPLLRAVAEPTRAIAIGFQGLADPLKLTVAVLGVGVAGSLTLTGGFLLFLSFVPRIVEGLKLINIGFGALALTAGPLAALMLSTAAAIGVFRMAADEFGKTDLQLVKVQQQLADARRDLIAMQTYTPADQQRIQAQETEIARLAQIAEGLEAILKFDADAQARGTYRRTLKAPAVATDETIRATKEQIEAFQGLQRQLAAMALSPVDRKFDEMRAKLAETTKEMGPLRAAGEALADTLVRLAREEDIAAFKLQPLAEEAKKLEERLGVWSDILAPLDLTLGGFGSEVEELGSTLNANADTFNTWGIRLSEADGFLNKLTITTAFLETAVTATAEPMDAFEAQLFALAEAATEAKEAQSKLAVEMTQKVMDSMNRLRGEAEAFGKIGVEADKARLSRDLLQESYAALNPVQKAWIDQLAREKTALEQARIASDLYLSGLTKLDAERAAGAAAGIKEQQGRLQTTLSTLQTINDAEKETGLLRSRIAQEQMKTQGDFYGFIGESLRQMVLETQDAWRDVDAMVRGVAQSMQRSLSDLFFNVLTGQVNSLRDVFKNLWQAIIRQITDFLASAAVRALLQFAASAFGFGGGGGGGGLGTAVASGAVQLAVDQTTGNLVAVGGGGGTAAGSWFGAGQNMSMGASLAGSFPGIANTFTNFAAGGISGTLLGLPASMNFGAGALELGAGVGAIGGEATAGTAGWIGTAGAISNLTVALAALGVVINNMAAAFGPDPTGPSAVGTYAGTIAGGIIGGIIANIPGAIIGAALGSMAGGLLGGLFGGEPELTHAQRESLETQRVLGAAGGAQEDILGARTYRQLYERLRTYSTGYVGGTSSVAVSPYITDAPGGLSQDVFRQMVASGGIRLPSGFADVEDFMARNTWTGAGGGWGPGAALPVFTGNQNANYPTVTYEGFREIARQHPDWLQFNIQAGVTPGNLTAANQAMAESTQALIEQMNEVQDQIDEILDDLFRELVELDGAADPTADAIAAFREGLTELTTAAQENIDRQRIAMLDLTDPKEILEQTARIRDLIHQRYEGEIELIQNFTASVQKAADGWRRIGDAVRAQVDQMRLGPFGPTNPSLALTQTTEAFDAALAAFQADRTLETADAVAKAIDPLLTAASQMFARPSTEFRAIFDRTAGALEEIGGYADEQAQTLEETIAEILGEGVTIEQLTADNTSAMRDELMALRQDVLHVLGEIGYGDETAISELTRSLLDANTPAAVAQAQELSEAQRQTVLLAIIAQNTLPTETADTTGALIQTPFGAVTPENARALYQSYGPVASYQSGTDYVPRTGLAVLHEGERVTPAWAAGGGVSISIGDINVSGAADPRTTADEIVETIERRLREPGRLRTAVRAVARSA